MRSSWCPWGNAGVSRTLCNLELMSLSFRRRPAARAAPLRSSTAQPLSHKHPFRRGRPLWCKAPCTAGRFESGPLVLTVLLTKPRPSLMFDPSLPPSTRPPAHNPHLPQTPFLLHLATPRPWPKEQSRRNSRVPKLLPHLFFPYPATEFTVYIDVRHTWPRAPELLRLCRDAP